MKIDDLRKEIDLIDEKMAELFEKRMDVSAKIADLKRRFDNPIEDSNREEAMLLKSSDLIKNGEYLPFYKKFLKSNIEISKAYQRKITDKK